MSRLPSWKDAKRIAIDCETRDELLKTHGIGSKRGGYTVGWSFTIEDGPSFYLPIRHEGGGNLPVEQVLGYLRKEAKNFTGEIVGANVAYDIDYASEDGIEFPNVEFFRDVQIADPLIYELHTSRNLEAIGERNDIKSKEETLLHEAGAAYGAKSKKETKSVLWRMHSKLVGLYAERDSSSPLEIYAKQRELLEKEGIWQVFDLESRVLPVLVRMRRRGVRVDEDKLSQIELWARKEQREALARIKHATGYDIGVGNIWKSNAVAPAFEAIGITLDKTAAGNPQLDAEVFDRIDHPVAKDVRWARKVDKMDSTFAASIRKYITNGRVHCTYNQIARETESGDNKGGKYGRLSSIHPNLQQQYNPEKEPKLSAEWRKIFIPEEGCVWGVNDFSQQEPRWAVHFASVLKLPMAEEAARRYREDAKTDFHTMMTKLINGDKLVEQLMSSDDKASKGRFKELRGAAKLIFLGLIYGEGGPKLCADLGLPTRWRFSTSGPWKDRKSYYFDSKHEAYMCRAELEDYQGWIGEVAGAEGEKLLTGFDEAVPFVKKLAKMASEQAKKNGYVKTVMGRKLHFPKKFDGSYDWLHKALNRVIQGSSGDQTKLALVEIDKAGHFIQLQNHDDICGSYSSEKEAKEVGRIMSECIKFVANPRVPFNVDTECGPSWGEVKEV